MTQPPLLAVIRFDTEDIDGFLHTLTRFLIDSGLVVRGALQTRGDVSGDCHCADMDLVTIGSGRMFRISQPLGPAARGCRLNPGALAECSAFLERELDEGADLLVLNRFGQGESEGRGFRDLIVHALNKGVPVLTALRPTYTDAWAEFSANANCDLSMNRQAVMNWLAAAQEVHHVA